MIFRHLVIAGIAILLAVQTVRNAAVMGLATLHPATAAKVWSGHPEVEIGLGLAEIGRASHDRKPIDHDVFARFEDATQKAPLDSEPFLVRGVQAQTNGKMEAAKRAFEAAQWRDPRSLPAAYFLANYDFRSGKILEGLEQTTLLARLSPQGADALAPFVAAYAQNRANWPQIRSLFQSQNGLESQVLAVLARNPANANALLALADPANRRPTSPWLSELLQSLIADGNYSRANAIWSSIGGGHADGQTLYDASFSSPEAPPPFNWSLASSSVGIAERQPGKRLHVIFYGNEDGTLASELLLLRPGNYRLAMMLSGVPVHPETLSWSLRCDKSSEPIANETLDEVVKRGWTFRVPANCPAQWLDLSGRGGDVIQQAEVTLTGLSLTPLTANG